MADQSITDQNLINYLSGFISENRLNSLNKILAQRTRYITVVLEDIYQSHNASAVLRSCDCFGVQDVHIIENKNTFNVNPKVVLGATKWLNLHRYNSASNNTKQTITNLKNKGYRIVATSPHSAQTNLEDFNLEKGKFALLFGTELTGLSDEALNNSEEFLMIPTVGFTESLNISVSAAICLHALSHKLRNSTLDYHLTENESDRLKLKWLRNSIKSWPSIEKRFHSKKIFP